MDCFLARPLETEASDPLLIGRLDKLITYFWISASVWHLRRLRSIYFFIFLNEHIQLNISKVNTGPTKSDLSAVKVCSSIFFSVPKVTFEKRLKKGIFPQSVCANASKHIHMSFHSKGVLRSVGFSYHGSEPFRRSLGPWRDFLHAVTRLLPLCKSTEPPNLNDSDARNAAQHQVHRQMCSQDALHAARLSSPKEPLVLERACPIVLGKYQCGCRCSLQPSADTPQSTSQDFDRRPRAVHSLNRVSLALG